MANPDDPKPDNVQKASLRIPWIGLEVNKKTDLVALTAFVLALAGILYQVLGHIRGAEVELFRPEQVTIIAHDYGNGKQYVRISARMAYANRGQPGYNATVRLETVQFRLGGTTYEQAWQAFQNFDQKGRQLVVQRFIGDASPVPVMAGSAISHETYFAPRPLRCAPGTSGGCDTYMNYLEWERFVILGAREQQLQFEFVADLYGERRPKTVRCSTDLDKDFFLNLVLNSWASAPCWSL